MTSTEGEGPKHFVLTLTQTNKCSEAITKSLLVLIKPDSSAETQRWTSYLRLVPDEDAVLHGVWDVVYREL